MSHVGSGVATANIIAKSIVSAMRAIMASTIVMAGAR
jgi:hypothetical protein